MPSDTDKVETPPVATEVEGEATSAKTAEEVAKAKYLLDFLNREEAEKGFKAMQAGRTRAEQKAAELARELENERKEKLLAQTLNNLAKERAAESGKSVASERKKVEEEINSMIQSENPASALTHMGDIWLSQVRGEMRGETETVKSELERVKAELNELKEATDPFNQQNKERIDQLAEETGLTKQQASKVLRTIAAQQVTIDPPRVSSGANGAGAGAAASAKDKQKTRALTAEEREFMRRTMPDLDAEKMRI